MKKMKTCFYLAKIFLNIGKKMAIYEYKCQQDEVVEIIRPIGLAPEPIICFVCGDKK